MKRIAVGGFQHETNTFSHTRADLENFLAADAWPALAKGAEMTRAVAGMNLPISGFSEEALSLGYEIVPLLWCSATPSGPVTEDAFESIWAMIAEELGKESLDGVYLDLHGAMVAEFCDDGEGEILRRIRNIVGDTVPIVASLDLHANVSPAMVEESSVLLAYRTYPHVDMAETGRRAARVMDLIVSSPHEPPHKSFSQLPFLIPLPWQCTLIEPMSSLVTHAEKLEKKEGILSLSLTTGFPLADIPDCGPAVMAYGTDDASVDHAARCLARMALDREADFQGRVFTPEEAACRAIKVSGTARGPVILADTQDNPGGGGTSDGVTILKVLVKEDADAVVAMIYDPEVAEKAHEAGIGAVFRADLGGKSGVPDESPLGGEYRVEALGDGILTGTGPFYAGCRMDLGPMAHLRLGNVRVVVSSRKQQAADRSFLHHVGIRPEEERILVLKSSVHFRADFSEMASEILLVEAPGYNTTDPGQLRFRRLREGVRTTPIGRKGK